ncbi:GNAT family N-acetyltransferase [Antribacter gilvus]|uniref:GNAT family N-acetyltransferase n=1 Tax=Antribacter gilvus TaxID=2304675 RepID=UPI0019817E8C|nr:GNAT family N-acetyltransferase [Antribacter gilvus]
MTMILEPLTVGRIEAVMALTVTGAPFVRTRSRSDYWLFATLFSSTCPVMVVDHDVVGSVVAFVSQETPADLYVQDVVTSSGHRRRGVAGRLLSAVAERGRELGCSRMYLTSEPENYGAHAAWLSLGFENVPASRKVEGMFVTPDFKGAGYDRAVYQRFL